MMGIAMPKVPPYLSTAKAGGSTEELVGNVVGYARLVAVVSQKVCQMSVSMGMSGVQVLLRGIKLMPLNDFYKGVLYEYKDISRV